MRLIADMVAFTVNEIPSWNPINICSYHLQEAGATPVQEIAFALSNAIAVLDSVRERGQVSEEDFPRVFGRISFFVNAGVRFIEEHAKLRAMGVLWEELGRERYGVTDPRFLRMRYGVQVNSLGLTEAQPENNVPRIVLEALAVTLGRDARARAIQLPAWNEALGLPRPWDQQWSLRIQQILANETDLLDYPDIFEGSKVMEGLVARADRRRPQRDGRRRRARRRDDERGRRLHEGPPRRVAPRPARADRVRRAQGDRPELLHRDRGLAADRRRRRRHPHSRPRGRAGADRGARGVEGRSATTTPSSGRSTALAAAAARRVGEPDAGDDRGRQGRRDDRRVGRGAARASSAPTAARPASTAPPPAATPSCSPTSASSVAEVSESIGHRIRILVAKPGLDGHSNGAEQIAVRARDVGMEVIYQGIRLTPEEIAASAVQEDVDVIGLSILSGSHRELVPRVVELIREAGVDAPVVVGGIIPPGRRREARRGRHRPGLHAQGLRPEPDHGRHRRARRRARGRLAAGLRPVAGDRVPDRRDRRRRRPATAARRRRSRARRRRLARSRGAALDARPRRQQRRGDARSGSASGAPGPARSSTS